MKGILKRLLIASLVVVFLTIACFNVAAAASTNKYNTGERHVVCDTLSSSAKSYYSANYAYNVLSEQSYSQLLNSLRQLMKNTHTYAATYNNCKFLAVQTDSTAKDGKINLLYTSKYATEDQIGDSGAVWNREHVWPKSLGGFKTSGAGSDLHHVRPSDAKVNSIRANLKYGEVTSGNNATGSALVNNVSGGTYSGSYFEPLDNVKGDVARICLYVYVRYGGELSDCSNITNVFQSVDVLLSWCALDPVDEWEMGRNDVVEDIQGNRNVFIDYPEYAWLIFNKEIPNNMVTPSGEAKQSAPTVESATQSATNQATSTVESETDVSSSDSNSEIETVPSVSDIVTEIDTEIDTDLPTTDIPSEDGTVPPQIQESSDTDDEDPSPNDGPCKTHTFGEWEEIGSNGKMRSCTRCGLVEFSSVKDETAEEDTSNSDIEESVTDVLTEEGGCDSSITASALVVVGIIGTAVIVKKKED